MEKRVCVSIMMLMLMALLASCVQMSTTSSSSQTVIVDSVKGAASSSSTESASSITSRNHASSTGSNSSDKNVSSSGSIGSSTSISSVTVVSSNSASSNSTTTTSINTAPTPINRAEIKKILDNKDENTFDILKKKHNLYVEKQTQNFLTATSSEFPGLAFEFSNLLTDDFTLTDVYAPVSLLLPEYVGKSISKIPIVLAINEKNVQLADQYGNYTVVLSKPDVLSARDVVYMD